MKVYVINLRSSVQRRKIMEKQLDKLDIPYKIFDAVKGADITGEEIERYYDMDYYNARPGHFTPGAIGCTLSHYFIYQEMLADNIDVAVILEDDMILHKDFSSTVPLVSKQLKDDEVVLLFYQSYEKIRLAASSAVDVGNGHLLYQAVCTKLLRSTGGYMISHEAARSMVNKLLPFSSFPDDWKSFYDREILNGIRIVYPGILRNSYEATTISPNTKGGTAARKILTTIEKYRIFPFFNFLKWRRKKNIAKTKQCVITNEVPLDLR
jgi:glycosyl transferase, family 25